MVLKFRAHRIYLGGLFMEIELRYCRDVFIVNEWTYPDYNPN
ncbi:MAG: DUF4416 family protein [Caldithrix sp.]|nr:MAG: DUF4416 family protein [Caldithrix sp.]